MVNVVIFGCGGHARSVADILISSTPDIEIIFIDDNASENEKIWRFETNTAYQVKEEDNLFFANGDNFQRMSNYKKFTDNKIISIISGTAYIGINASIGKGSFVGNFCHIGPEAKIGENTIVNNGALIEHEAKIGAHCHIGPNATISGRSIIGDLVFIGVGAIVIDKIKICSNVIVGAGTTVIKDITIPGTYAGCPARKIR